MPYHDCGSITIEELSLCLTWMNPEESSSDSDNRRLGLEQHALFGARAGDADWVRRHSQHYIQMQLKCRAMERLGDLERISHLFSRLNLGELTKRERGYALVMLGFLFDSRTGVLRVPEAKCKEILALLRSVLELARRRQSVSLQELSSLGGKLMWACAGVVCGRFYLRNLRKLVVA
eukprot:782864-Rhodomonas_salina.1